MGSPIQIPDHTLLRMIGKGSYGEVWLAQNAVGTYRAVKIVYRDRFRDSRPYEREFEGIKKFEPISRSHEGFIDILHIGTNLEQGFFYYVMEIGDDVAGEGVRDPETYTSKTPEQTIQANKRLSVEECTELGLLLTAALSSLHKHDLVHRDIKPANILYVNGVPKLADIGLVAQTSSQSSIVGTIGYMPPEGPGTPQADIYSLGKVLYELLTGNDRQLFPNIPPELLDVEETDDLVELNEILVKACHPTPSMRYNDAWDMHAELTALTNGKSIKRLRFLENKVAMLKKGFVASILGLLTLTALGYAYSRERFHQGEARQRSTGAQISQGTQKLLEGDYALSLKYFLAAQMQSEKPKDNDFFRIRAIYQQIPKVRTMLFRNRGLMSGGFHPDKDVIVLGFLGSGVDIVDLNMPNPKSSIFGPVSPVDEVSFSPDGNFVITSSEAGGAEIWDASTHVVRKKVPGTVPWIMSASFSPDGLEVATGGSDKTVGMWKLGEEDLRLKIRDARDQVDSVQFSHDGKSIAAASREGVVRIYDRKSGDLIRSTKSVGTWVYAVAFNPDDSRVVTGCADRTCRVYSTLTGEEIFPPIMHSDAVTSVCFSPDGNWIVASCLDSTIRFYDCKTGKPLDRNQVLHHSGRVNRIGFNSEGNYLLSTSSDGTVRIWDLAPALTSGDRFELDFNRGATAFINLGGKPIPTSTKPVSRISPGGLLLVTQEGDADHCSGHVYHMRSGQELGCIPLLSPDLQDLSFSENEKFIGTSSSNQAIIYNIEGIPKQIGQIQTSPFQKIFINPEGTEAATSVKANFVIWDIARGKKKFENLEASVDVYSIQWSSNYFVAASRDGWFTKCSARVFDRRSGKRLKDLQHDDGVLVARFTTDEKFLITGSEDRTVCIWDTRTWQQAVPPMLHPDEVFDVCYEASSNRLLTACRDGNARVWDFSTGEPLSPPIQFGRGLKYCKFISPTMIQVWDDGHYGNWLGRWTFMPEDRLHAELVQQATIGSGSLDTILKEGNRFQDYQLPARLKTSSENKKKWHQALQTKINRVDSPFAWNFHQKWIEKLEKEK